MDKFGAIRAKARAVIQLFESKGKGVAFDENSGPHSKLDEIADACYGLSVMEDEALPPKILGALDLSVDSISYRTGLEYGRRVYTIAHELGHRALEHPERRFEDTEDDVNEAPDVDGMATKNGVYRSYDTKDVYELEANVFAAELLAPAELVRAKMTEGDYWTLDRLCDYFGLSHLAMLNQMTSALRTEAAEEPAKPEAPTLKPDPKHDQAVDVDAPALVLAGPGAGKTRILVRRYQRLVAEGFSPQRILALTFSNKAAAEMRERLSAAIPDRAHEIRVFTFHSFGLELLKQHGDKVTLQHPAELLMTLRQHLYELPMGGYESLQAPVRNLGVLLDAVSRAKDERKSPDEFKALADKWIISLEANPDADEKALELASKARDAAEFYAAYEDLLRRLNIVDYGDLIVRAVDLLESPLGEKIRNGYDHILVDEFQDINHASGLMVKALAGPEMRVWAVGDIRQSIYRFRGASPANIARFRHDYPDANVVSLDRNYRSVEDIVACGQAVEIPLRKEALELPSEPLVSDRGRPTGKAAVGFLSAVDSPSEVFFIVDLIKAEKPRVGARSIAVLCRTRNDAQRIASALEQNDIATTWPGELENSRVFKDVLAILYIAVGDMRGFVRLADSTDFPLSRHDFRAVLKWAKAQTYSARSVLYAAADGEIDGLSEGGKESLTKLRDAIGKIASQPSPFHALTTYLFEYSRWCRTLLRGGGSGAGRTLTTVRQLCSVAKTFKPTSEAPKERIEEFIDYVETCIAAGRLDVAAPDFEDFDAVNVMTVHGSKGLEWPLVVVPCLAHGKFPNTTYHEPIPVPEGLVSNYDPADDAAEEACLFYVAMTRARDRLVLTAAERYGKAAKPSSYLEPVLRSLEEKGFLERLEVGTAAAAAVPTPSATTTGFVFDGPIPYAALRAFDTCPRQFEYGYVLGLSGGDTGYRDFHRAVNHCCQWVLATRREGEIVSDEVAQDYLEETWTERGPVGHWYEPRLKNRAQFLIRNLLVRLRRGDDIELSQGVDLVTGDRIVRVIVDEIERADSIRLKRIHYGRPAKSHLGTDNKDHIPALLASVGEQEFPGQTVEVRIRYPLLDVEKGSLAKATLIKNRREKMPLLASQAEAGPYPPKPGMMSCRSCAFQLVCTSTGDEAD